NLNPAGYQWDYRFQSDIQTESLFFNSDIAFWNNLHLQGGVHWDNYHVHSRNAGLSLAAGTTHGWYTSETSALDYQVSVNYETDWGLIPYFTYAKTKSLEGNKGGSIDPALIIGKKYLSPSALTEIGVKGNLLDGALYFAVDGYSQYRDQRDVLSGVIVEQHNQGVEGELRYAVTHNFDLLATVSYQKTMLFGANTLLFNAAELGLPGQNIYGGEFLTSTVNIPSMAHGFEDTTIPRGAGSLFGTYRFDFDDSMLKLTAGANIIGPTSGVYIGSGAIRNPGYVTLRGSASYSWDRYTLDLQVENLTDQRYFYLGQTSYSEVAALPGLGREFHLRLAVKI
ncbi:MAG TPA: TonB-dependent receptor, partial [Rhizomicrobium sp.]|nr:TonB-dependent receptor [Rhizomicrobium sp.]